jgi:hypothetical protein
MVTFSIHDHFHNLISFTALFLIYLKSQKVSQKSTWAKSHIKSLYLLFKFSIKDWSILNTLAKFLSTTWSFHSRTEQSYLSPSVFIVVNPLKLRKILLILKNFEFHVVKSSSNRNTVYIKN